ncbi:TetR/AcrR family transcriptional regulator [Streptomyces spectabilis]|uniref:AcrR family transcriptional regulator n=1 Tax=Streptomyces spectabilis TaxID=68270 RepID=A0A5P2XF37_STRST|nr:TetR/AcrR family transcriptional regulator [Streptomyces spectabilis]MBB5104305.1 AcrR family transcriptional regulator [Streptomyces spectabilis]MCI3905336.1 TetR/AcrR family transcriptional regulator [Streptomyces spectabilis]QEV62334.1 TetR/AcrR family transcriptional regulator [Streptomyces spectabilis]GGU99102.1 TetR family transcriptional regulator [Streptomyces spectabilis]
MGHREDLLAGAKRCLLEKGFVRTTARDVVKESGTNLASIGYHYGSKDALLAEAYISLIEDLGDGFVGPPDGDAGPGGSLERFEKMWGNVIQSFPEARGIWMLTLEFITQGERLAGVRDIMVKAQVQGRAGLAALLLDLDDTAVPEDVVNAEGRLYTTLLNGLMVQWLFDPGSATTAGQLTEGLRRVAERASAAEGRRLPQS